MLPLGGTAPTIVWEIFVRNNLVVKIYSLCYIFVGQLYPRKYFTVELIAHATYMYITIGRIAAYLTL